MGSLGFSFGAAPVQAASTPSTVASEMTKVPANQLLVRTAAVAAQIGVTVSFFSIIRANHFVARMAIPLPGFREDETFDQKRAKNIIRKLKTEKTEPSNDQRPDK